MAAHCAAKLICCERKYMDYIIAGVASAFLFGYLIYALLKPEKF
jgi:K+-transporting ATPase KdpF subunit